MSVREIEIVECLDVSVTEAIKQKLKKRYNKNTWLVCFLSPIIKEVGVIIIQDFRELSEEIVKLEPSIDNVFVVFSGIKLKNNIKKEEDFSGLLQSTCVQIFPMFGSVSVSPNNYCESFYSGKGNQGAWLRFSRRGKGVGFEDVILGESPKLFD